MSWTGKVALVTGGASGIGAALCAALADHGAVVYAGDLNPGAVEDSRIRGVSLDVTDASAFRSSVNTIIQEQGRIDVLVNNAGIGAAGEVQDVELATWRRAIEVNTMGVIHGVDAVYHQMMQQGSGQIINIASGAGLCPRPGMVPYATSKAAVIGLSNSLRPEAAHYGIRVNCACPGYIATNIMEATEYSGVDGDGLRAAIPLKAMSAARCAELVLQGAARNRGLITVSTATKFEYLLTRFAPRLALRIAAFRATKFREHRTR